jgi:hypothetical protein
MAVNGDMKAHESTYHGIISLLRWGALAVFIIAFGVIWIISH